MLFPTLFVAIVAKKQGDHVASWVVFKGEPGGGRTVEIKEYGGRLRSQLRNFTLLVLFEEQVALPIDGNNRAAMRVAIVADECVEQGRGQFDGGGMEWDDQPLGVGLGLRCSRGGALSADAFRVWRGVGCRGMGRVAM